MQLAIVPKIDRDQVSDQMTCFAHANGSQCNVAVTRAAASANRFSSIACNGASSVKLSEADRYLAPHKQLLDRCLHLKLGRASLNALFLYPFVFLPISNITRLEFTHAPTPSPTHSLVHMTPQPKAANQI